jgi:DNA-binding NtrC family response regulator
MLLRVILVMDEPALRRRVREALQDPDVVVESVSGKSHLWERAARKSCDVLIAAERAIPPPLESSVDLIRSTPSPPAVVVICRRDDPAHHGRLVAAGVDAALHEGLPVDTLADALAAVLARRREAATQSARRSPTRARPALADFVSDSEAMQTFMRTVHRVVESDASLLILGETGVGKERLAMAIHGEGPRSEGPFVAVNCGALPENLLESEMFGHEEGAFTGATRSRRGAFELAHNGTIFLDEIGDMPLHLQVKLLRVLQDREIRRVGGERAVKVDVRVMAASNRDLEAEVAEGRFRRDLYYRLSVVALVVPPLRQRREDIPALVASYVDYLRPRIGCPVFGISRRAVAALRDYDWPGNVRELINVVERAMLLCGGEQIGLDDLPEAISQSPPKASAASVAALAETLPREMLGAPLQEVRKAFVEKLERSYLAALLRETRGRVGQTASRAGITPRSLFEKMKRYGLRKEDFKAG